MGPRDAPRGATAATLYSHRQRSLLRPPVRGDSSVLPRLIQGGMGAGVSAWTLAREVSRLGQLGVVSGTALDTILIRRLWDGDTGGHMRRAIGAFPSREIGQAVLDRWFRAAGSPAGTPMPAPGSADDDVAPDDIGSVGEAAARRFRLAPLIGADLKPDRQALIVLANFVEVHLAKEGHDGVVGINYLEKIQFPTLPSLYGALLADVDVVLMGAGIPARDPGCPRSARPAPRGLPGPRCPRCRRSAVPVDVRSADHRAGVGRGAPPAPELPAHRVGGDLGEGPAAPVAGRHRRVRGGGSGRWRPQRSAAWTAPAQRAG